MRAHKYGAKPKWVDGIRFHSTKEANRYLELKLLEKAGEIEALGLQPSFSLHVAQLPGVSGPSGIGIYRADFYYVDTRTGLRVFEDVKGFSTPLFKWKKKHVEAQFGITITEV